MSNDIAGKVSAVDLATELTVAWLSNPSTRASVDDVKAFLASMNTAVAELAEPVAPAVEEITEAFEPAVSVRKSLASPDFIISMLDGKKYKTLKRHLARHGLTPDQYRERFGLKSDYPMTSRAYSEARTAMAKKIGLGRKPGQKVAPEPASDAPEKRASANAPSTKGKSVADAKAAAKAHLGGNNG